MKNNDFELKDEFLKKELQLAQRMHTNKEYLDNFFRFKIPEYVIMALIENKTYSEFCLFVNISRINRRITEKEAKQLKYTIKKFCNISSEYDKVSDKFIQDLYNNPVSDSFLEWSEHYHKDEKYNLKQIFTKEELDIIKRLNIEIQDKIYTEYELDILEMDVFDYYKDEDENDNPEDSEYKKELSEVGVSQEEYEKLLDKFNNIEK